MKNSIKSGAFISIALVALYACGDKKGTEMTEEKETVDVLYFCIVQSKEPHFANKSYRK